MSTSADAPKFVAPVSPVPWAMGLLAFLSLVAYAKWPVMRGVALLVLTMLPLLGALVMPARRVRKWSMGCAAGLLLVSLGLAAVEPQAVDGAIDGWAALMGACMVMSVGWLTGGLNAHHQTQQQQHQALQDALDNLQKEATKDMETGLPNQAYMREWMRQAAKRALRSSQPLTLALLARDAASSAERGSEADERTLDHWVTCANQVFRENDVVARWSGEELLVLFEGSEPSFAREGLSRLRKEAAGLSFSAGVVAWTPQEPIDDALARARQALARAQTHGGQRDELA